MKREWSQISSFLPNLFLKLIFSRFNNRDDERWDDGSADMRDPRDNYGGSDRGPRDGRGPDRGDSDRSLRDSYGGRGGGEGGRDSYGRGDGGRGFEQDQPQPPKRKTFLTQFEKLAYIIFYIYNNSFWSVYFEALYKIRLKVKNEFLQSCTSY